jgi:hypothetical protein
MPRTETALQREQRPVGCYGEARDQQGDCDQGRGIAQSHGVSDEETKPALGREHFPDQDA